MVEAVDPKERAKALAQMKAQLEEFLADRPEEQELKTILLKEPRVLAPASGGGWEEPRAKFEFTKEAGGFSKHDSGKPRMDLLEPDFLEGLADVLTQGAATHGDRNWQLAVENWKAGRDRYVAALLRHCLDVMRLKQADADSGRHPCAHIAACAMFIQWMDDWAAKKGHP